MDEEKKKKTVEFKHINSCRRNAEYKPIEIKKNIIFCNICNKYFYIWLDRGNAECEELTEAEVAKLKN